MRRGGGGKGNRSVAGVAWVWCAWKGRGVGVPVTGRVALRPNRSLRAERAVSLASAALANRQIGFGRVRPRPVLRAGGTTFGLPYGASLTLAPTLRRRSAALPQDGYIYPALSAGSPIGGASRPGEPQRLTRRVRPTFPLQSFSAQTPCDCSCAEPWSGRAGRARGLARRAGAAGGGWRGGCAGGAA